MKRTLDIEERMLFHGTGHSNIQAICMFNFDWRLTGSNGDVYGKGTKVTPLGWRSFLTNVLLLRQLLCPGCQVLQ